MEKTENNLHTEGLNWQNEEWGHLLGSGATIETIMIYFPYFPSIQDMDKRLQALNAACEKLPTDNSNNFRSDAFPYFLYLQMIPLQ